MKFTVEFHPALAAEIKEAKSWYEQEQSGLGADFDAELFERFAFIAANPYVFAIYKKNVRIARIKRFSYVILYLVEGNTIRFLAVVHSARSLSKWLKRS